MFTEQRNRDSNFGNFQQFNCNSIDVLSGKTTRTDDTDARQDYRIRTSHCMHRVKSGDSGDSNLDTLGTEGAWGCASGTESL